MRFDALLAIGLGTMALAGCTTSQTGSTDAGKPVVVAAFGVYTIGSCTSAEPPEATLTSPPANGSVSFSAAKVTFSQKGHACEGSAIDRRIVTYAPRPGFRGQDQFSVKYDYITSDGGRRASQGETYTVTVK